MGNVLDDISLSNIFLTLLLLVKYHQNCEDIFGGVSINEPKSSKNPRLLT